MYTGGGRREEQGEEEDPASYLQQGEKERHNNHPRNDVKKRYGTPTYPRAYYRGSVRQWHRTEDGHVTMR